MQAKCLAQHWHAVSAGERKLLPYWSGLGSRWHRALREEAHGDRPKNSSQRAPLLSASANAATSNDQAPGPRSISCPSCAGRKEDQKTG